MNPRLLSYVVWRLASVIPVLLGITLIAFLLGVLSPGDPATVALGLGENESGTLEQVAELRTKLGLDRPLPMQYLSWISGALHGDLGSSFITGKPILEDMLSLFPVTLRLAALASLIMTVLGIGLGTLQVFFPHRFVTWGTGALCSFLISIPEFSIALLLIAFFSKEMGWLPTSGVGGAESYILPALTVALPGGCALAPVVAAGIEKESSEYYALIARAKGLTRGAVLWYHVLKPALLPAVVFLGSRIGGLLAGAAVIESIFSLPGLGHYALDAIMRRDYPCLQGYVLFTGFVFVMINLLTDMVLLLLNPRMSLGEDE